MRQSEWYHHSGHETLALTVGTAEDRAAAAVADSVLQRLGPSVVVERTEYLGPGMKLLEDGSPRPPREVSAVRLADL